MNGWHNCADPPETFLIWVYFDTILQGYKHGNQGEVNPHSSDHPRRIEVTVQRIKFKVTIIIIVLKDIGGRKDWVWNLLGGGCRTEEIPTDVSTLVYFFSTEHSGGYGKVRWPVGGGWSLHHPELYLPSSLRQDVKTFFVFDHKTLVEIYRRFVDCCLHLLPWRRWPNVPTLSDNISVSARRQYHAEQSCMWRLESSEIRR